MKKEDVSFYLLILFSIVVIWLSFLLIKPLLTPVLASVVVALLFYPIHKKIENHVESKVGAAFLSIGIVFLLIALPLGFIVNSFTQESYAVYLELKKLSISQKLPIECQDGEGVCLILKDLNEYIKQPQVQYYIEQAGEKVRTYLFEYGSKFVLGLPGKILDIVIFFFALFYLLKDGNYILGYIRKLLPVDAVHQKELIKKTRAMTYGVLYGQIVTSIVQGVVAGIGFYFVGMSSPIFLAIAVAFASIVPVLGTSLVWFPVSAYLFITGNSIGDNSMVTKSIFLFFYGLLLVSTIDNLIRPKLIGDKTKAHPLLVFLGIVGGLYMFGMIGIFIGPLILTSLVAVLELYEEVRDEKS